MDQITNDITRLVAAYAFEVDKHTEAKQTREDLSTPYWVHPFRVVERLRAVGIDDYDVLSAAVLHDVVEDTETSLDIIEAKFGNGVRQIVADMSQGPRQPLIDYHTHIRNSSGDSQSVKLADKWDDVNELRRMRYATYGNQQPLEYVTDADATLASCPDGNSQLQEFLKIEIMEARRQFATP